MLRKPHVAGQFYPASLSALKRQLNEFINKEDKKEEVLGLISPHAGYIYSGSVAASCFAQAKITPTVIILGPNHTGYGSPYSIMVEGVWQMPMGNVEVDASLAKMILEESEHLQEDLDAHIYEHSIEVQLPFLQYFVPDVKIVPIIVAGADFAIYQGIAQAIVRALKATKKCLIVASSDMTHYEPEQKAKQKDNLAIEAILKLDGQELAKRIEEFNITMCGYGPAVIMLCAAKELGATEARVIKYQTSGDVSGDYSSVVGYAGIMVK